MKLAETAKILKDWWWVASLLLGALVFMATLPTRIRNVEASNAAQDQQLKQLSEIQAYWKGVYEYQQQRAPTQPMVPGIPANPNTPGIPEVWIEPALVDGWLVCADGEGRWWWRTGVWDWGDGRGCAE